MSNIIKKIDDKLIELNLDKIKAKAYQTNSSINSVNNTIKSTLNNSENKGIDEMNFNNNSSNTKINITDVKTDAFGNEWVYSKNHDGIDIITVNGKPLDIFGEYNLSTSQYGGSQMDLVKSVYEKSDGTYNFTDKNIYNTLKKYFPDASDHDYYSYLQIIQNSACQYTACINSLFKQYEGREEEFYQTFGFPMYEVAPNGYLDYNYEKLIVEYYSYVESKLNLQVKDIDSVSPAIESGTPYAQELFGEFLSQYNVEVDSGSNQYLINGSNNLNMFSNLLTALNPFGDVNESFKIAYLASQKGPNSHMILSAANFNLYSVDNNQKGKLTDTGVGGHAMYVTGITNDGYLKVSSWGNEYAVDLSELPLSLDSRCSYQIIRY